jgi:hypothetical protein
MEKKIGPNDTMHFTEFNVLLKSNLLVRAILFCYNRSQISELRCNFKAFIINFVLHSFNWTWTYA